MKFKLSVLLARLAGIGSAYAQKMTPEEAKACLKVKRGRFMPPKMIKNPATRIIFDE